MKPTKAEITAALEARLEETFRDCKYTPIVETAVKDEVYMFLRTHGLVARHLDIWLDRDGYLHIEADDYIRMDEIN